MRDEILDKHKKGKQTVSVKKKYSLKFSEESQQYRIKQTSYNPDSFGIKTYES